MESIKVNLHYLKYIDDMCSLSLMHFMFMSLFSYVHLSQGCKYHKHMAGMIRIHNLQIDHKTLRTTRQTTRLEHHLLILYQIKKMEIYFND